MIAANMGIGFWPQFTWGDMGQENVRLVRIDKPMCRRDLIITLRKKRVEDPVVRDFYSYLTKYFEDKFHVSKHE